MALSIFNLSLIWAVICLNQYVRSQSTVSQLFVHNQCATDSSKELTKLQQKVNRIAALLEQLVSTPIGVYPPSPRPSQIPGGECKQDWNKEDALISGDLYYVSDCEITTSTAYSVLQGFCGRINATVLSSCASYRFWRPSSKVGSWIEVQFANLRIEYAVSAITTKGADSSKYVSQYKLAYRKKSDLVYYLDKEFNHMIFTVTSFAETRQTIEPAIRARAIRLYPVKSTTYIYLAWELHGYPIL